MYIFNIFWGSSPCGYSNDKQPQSCYKTCVRSKPVSLCHCGILWPFFMVPMDFTIPRIWLIFIFRHIIDMYIICMRVYAYYTQIYIYTYAYNFMYIQTYYILYASLVSFCPYISLSGLVQGWMFPLDSCKQICGPLGICFS